MVGENGSLLFVQTRLSDQVKGNRTTRDKALLNISASVGDQTGSQCLVPFYQLLHCQLENRRKEATSDTHRTHYVSRDDAPALANQFPIDRLRGGCRPSHLPTEALDWWLPHFARIHSYTTTNQILGKIPRRSILKELRERQRRLKRRSDSMNQSKGRQRVPSLTEEGLGVAGGAAEDL